MSGPFDRADDPDEVTLWAGRLRPWPANPPAAADGGSPAAADADDPDDATVRSHADDPDDATVRADVREPDDATVIARRADAVAEPDDATVIARRVDIAADADDRTVVARPAAPEAELDDATVRRAPVEERAARSPELLPVDDTEPGLRARRSSAPAVDESPDDSTRPRRAPGGVDDTQAGTRRARRADAADASASRRSVDAGPQAVDGAVREARVPAALGREIYDPRVDAPIRVARSVPPARSGLRDDPALVRPRPARRGAWRALLIGTAVVLLLAAGVAAAVLLLG